MFRYESFFLRAGTAVKRQECQAPVESDETSAGREAGKPPRFQLMEPLMWREAVEQCALRQSVQCEHEGSDPHRHAGSAACASIDRAQKPSGRCRAVTQPDLRDGLRRRNFVADG